MGRDPLLLLLLLAIFVLAAIGPAAADDASDDASAIRDLIKSVPGLSSIWAGDNVCHFKDVSCERGASGRVTSLNLAEKGLSGTLPPSLSTLTALKFLQLQGNALTGELPSLAAMAALTRLSLDRNAFTSLPADFLHGLASLQYLSLDDMPRLKPWSVPDDLAGSPYLDTFSASNASIAGPFPAVLGNLSSLTTLRLSYNNLTGELPEGLGTLGLLETLQLNNQQSRGKLSGRIDVIASMKSLKLLWLQSNAFTGPIPDLDSGMRLEAFNVRDNLLTGVVPASLTGLTSLKNASLSNNFFQGPKPVFAAKLDLDMSAGNGFCSGPCGALATTLLEVAEGFGYPYSLAQTWKGNNPCDSWLGVSCRVPDVVRINLPHKNITGTISPSLAKITTLESIDLSDNQIAGEIPDDLTTLPSLMLFDVSNNNLTGELPAFKPSVKVSSDGNRFGESDGVFSSWTSGRSTNAGMIIGIVIAVLVLVACIGLLVRHRMKKKNVEKFRPVSTESPPGQSEMKINVVGTNGNSSCNSGSVTVQSELYSHVRTDSASIAAGLFESHGMELPVEVLLKATNNFSEDRILGKGGFGVVFKGTLNDKLVAVKRCDGGSMGTKGHQEFMAEIDVLTKVRHRHLVALFGYCIHGNERLLVYEYMSCGTLREHLCDLQRSGYTPLTWTQRITIALDVARGIEYLHGLAQETFIHRDLKPSNILLDQDFRAKVSDFGLVKLANDTDKSMMTRVAGTFGYLAPEYATTGKVTTKVDVYAYGVILMEMISGRKVLDDSLPDDETHLVTTFRKSMLDKEKFRRFVDPTMELSAEAWNKLLEVSDLARHCTAREPYQRPDMSHCVNRLSSLLDEWKPTNIDDDDEEEEGETSEMALHEQLQKWRCEDFTISDSDSFNMPSRYN